MPAQLRCIRCPKTYPLKQIRHHCDCGGLIDVAHEGVAVSRELFNGRAVEPSGVWRYRELVAPLPSDGIVSKGEGKTNLYADDRLNRWTGCDGLRLKHEGENPTGSFKDRGMTVAVSHAKWVGARTVGCASTGNTSAAVAAYAAAAGMRAFTFVPEGKLALGKLVQTIGYGAVTVQVKGDFDAAMDLVQKVSTQHGVYLLNSLNPFRLEGQKAIMFESIQQLGWTAPDWIVVPGGNLGNTSAFGKALKELHDLKLISRVPRIAVIQATGANPFYAAFKTGFENFAPVKAETIATAIRIGNPVNYDKAVRAIQWTNGLVEQVTDDEIMAAKEQVDTVGIGCEPAAAASVAGVRKLVASGVIQRGDSVVAVLTGHILKDPDAILKRARAPIVVEPKLEAVEKLLRE